MAVPRRLGKVGNFRAEQARVEEIGGILLTPKSAGYSFFLG
jgi:hypothetical protein